MLQSLEKNVVHFFQQSATRNLTVNKMYVFDVEISSGHSDDGILVLS